MDSLGAYFISDSAKNRPSGCLVGDTQTLPLLDISIQFKVPRTNDQSSFELRSVEMNQIKFHPSCFVHQTVVGHF